MSSSGQQYHSPAHRPEEVLRKGPQNRRLRPFRPGCIPPMGPSDILKPWRLAVFSRSTFKLKSAKTKRMCCPHLSTWERTLKHTVLESSPMSKASSLRSHLKQAIRPNKPGRRRTARFVGGHLGRMIQWEVHARWTSDHVNDPQITKKR